MPWKECSVMDERLKFVARRLAGEAMADLYREFGISRKTGYKIFAVGWAPVQDLRAIMNSNTAHVRAELARHIEKITLTPWGMLHSVGHLEFCGASVGRARGRLNRRRGRRSLGHGPLMGQT